MIRKTTILAVLIACAPGSLLADEMPGISWELDDAISQIDRQSDDFDNAMARVAFSVRDSDGKVLREHSGNGFIQKNGDMRYNQDGGNNAVLVIKDKLEEYDKEANTVREVSLYRNKDRLEPFYRLGFSESGKDMKRDFLVTILGEEEIGDSRTLLLELTPEGDDDRAIVSRIHLWIDQASWMPRRQEFYSTQDRSVTRLEYTDMARNLRLNPDLFDDNWPRGVKKIPD